MTWIWMIFAYSQTQHYGNSERLLFWRRYFLMMEGLKSNNESSNNSSLSHLPFNKKSSACLKHLHPIFTVWRKLTLASSKNVKPIKLSSPISIWRRFGQLVIRQSPPPSSIFISLRLKQWCSICRISKFGNSLITNSWMSRNGHETISIEMREGRSTKS